MTYVTDTHALVFFASGKAARISRKCAQIFRRAEQQRDRVHVPVVCFFELVMLLERWRKSSLSFAIGTTGWHNFRHCQSNLWSGTISAKRATRSSRSRSRPVSHFT